MAMNGGSGGVGATGVTGTTVEARVDRIPVDIVEFEDVLFRENSAVMMPESPDVDPDADDPPATGLRAVGLALVLARLYPERGLLVTGHTAAQDDIPESFRLSRERADGILQLIAGNAERWALTCRGRHTVGDYKQILKHVHEYDESGGWKNGDWECDPGEVNNSFDEATQTALDNFAAHFNSDVAAHMKEIADLPPNLGEVVSGAEGNLLATSHWRAIYHVYELMVGDFLGKTRAELAALRGGLHWINGTVKMVGCAHSFPVPDGERGDEKIRSETDSRIEVLIYQAGTAESGALAACPTLPTSAVHDLAHDCPMWYERHFNRYYVGPGDRFAVVYHLKFRYYDVIKEEFRDIPGRVNVRAFKRLRTAGSAPEEIPCVTQYQEGIHSVRVRFDSEDPNPDFMDRYFYFAFEAPEHEGTPVVRMIHTRNADATPCIVNRPDNWAKLTFAQKFHYYDLPMKWSAHNYHTRHDRDHSHDCAFHEHLADKRQLKPFGANTTTRSEPLEFSLDDVVIFETAASHDQNIQDANQRGIAKALCDGRANPGSRVKVLVVDTANHTLRLWTKPSEDNTSLRTPRLAAPASPSRGANITTARDERIRFERNLVSGMAPNARIIHFRNDFFVIGRERTTDQPANWMDLAHRPVVGARKAVKLDAAFTWDRNVSDNEYGYTGDYGLRYFHHLDIEGTHPLSFLVIEVAWNVMLDTRGAQDRTAWSAVAANPDLDDISNFVNQAPYNAMARWNSKRFHYDEDIDPAADDSLRIKPFYFFDERETFEIPLADHPKNKDFVSSTLSTAQRLVHLQQVYNDGKFRTAQESAFGGSVRWVCFLVPEATGSWAWSVRDGATAHSAMLLRKSTYQAANAGWKYETGGGYSEDGDSYDCFVMAHELGHATSLQDEYIKKGGVDLGGDKRNYNAFSTHLAQYSMDPNNEAAIMFHNGVTRSRHCWYHLHYLNAQCPPPTAAGDHPLKGKKFIIRFVRGGKDQTFKRATGWTPWTGAAAPAGTPQIQGDLREPMVRDAQYRLPNWVTVSTTPDLTTLDAALRAKVRHEATDRFLFWTDSGAMTDDERDDLRDLFAGAADKSAVNRLQRKSRSQRRLHLALYDTAEDESSHGEAGSKGCFTKNQPTHRHHGVLLVRVMIGAAMGAPAMAAADAHDRLGLIRKFWDDLGQKYRLVGGPAGMDDLYVHFLSGFQEGHGGGDWNHALSFITDYAVTVSTAPDLTTLSVGLQADISYNNASRKVSYTGTGALSDAHRNELRGLFTGAADKRAMDELCDKTLLISADGRLDVAESVRADELKAHFLNMDAGVSEEAALKFLEIWVNDKMRSDGTTPATYSLQRITP